MTSGFLRRGGSEFFLVVENYKVLGSGFSHNKAVSWKRPVINRPNVGDILVLARIEDIAINNAFAKQLDITVRILLQIAPEMQG
jgi:hypothetical protein